MVGWIEFDMGGLKKIIFTVTNDLTFDQRMQKICRSITGAGYTVELVGRLRSFSIPLNKEPYKQTRLKCIFNKGKIFYVEYNIRLFIYLLFSKFDAACAIDLDTIAPVCIIGKFKGAKLIYDAHEYFTEVPEVVRRPAVKKVWQWVEKTFVPKFDLMYTVSPGLAELFHQKYNKPVEVIMNSPVLSKENYIQTPKNPKFILYQGALNEGRGLEPLIDSMKNIDCILKLAGEGDLSDQLRAQVKQQGLEQKVIFLGNVRPADLKKITREAYIGVNLVENKGLNYYYSLANKFFDYIHARVPQVCIGFPEYQKLNDKYNIAVLTKDCSIDEINSALTRLLNNAGLYAQLQKNCEVCSREMNWQQEELKLLNLYERLLG